MKTFKLPVIWKSSDAEYDDSIDFQAIELSLTGDDVDNIQSAIEYMSKSKFIQSVRVELGEIDFLDEDMEVMDDSDYVYDIFEIIIYRTGRCCPFMQGKYNSSNQIEFELFEINE